MDTAGVIQHNEWLGVYRELCGTRVTHVSHVGRVGGPKTRISQYRCMTLSLHEKMWYPVSLPIVVYSI